MVRPRGLPHMSFVISAVTTTQCSMKKLEKLKLTQSHQPIVCELYRSWAGVGPRCWLQVIHTNCFLFLLLHLSPYSVRLTLYYTTLNYTTLNYTTLHYTTLHYTTLHHTKVPQLKTLKRKLPT